MSVLNSFTTDNNALKTSIARFPEFTELTIEHKSIYNDLISSLPHVSDISFSTLLIWWTHIQPMKIAELNGNVVLHYVNDGDESESGYCLAGQNNVEESISTIFEYQSGLGVEERLVHVPEFVINKLDYKGYDISEELDYNEYILDAQALSTLEDSILSRTRRKVRRFCREAEILGDIEVKELDIQDKDVQEMLLDYHLRWREKYGAHNDEKGDETNAITQSLQNIDLGFSALSVWVGGVLYGYTLYNISLDGDYIVVNHIKYSNEVPHVFDYLTQQIAIKAVNLGAQWLNFEMDLGIEGLRFHKMGLRPVNFIRKFSIKPLK